MFFESVWRDLLYSLRTMTRSPAFAIAAMLVLGLGIGGNTAMFTVIRAVLLKPLDYREPDRLVYFSVENARSERSTLNRGGSRWIGKHYATRRE